MKKLDNKINDLFESARLVKSPVTLDKARYLIDTDKYLDKSNQTTNRRIFKMTLISALATGALSTALYLASLTNTNTVKPENKQINNNKTSSATAGAVRKSATKSAISVAKKSDDLKDKDVLIQKDTTILHGLHSIILTDQELHDFGIFFDELENTLDKDTKTTSPCIKFYTKLSEKCIQSHEFASSVSTFGFNNLEEVNEPFLKLTPDVITNFNGMVRSERTSYEYNEKESEYIKFSANIKKMFSSSFSGIDTNKLPNEIEKHLFAVDSLIKVFLINPLAKEKEGRELNQIISSINIYFEKVSKNSNIQELNDSSEVKTMFVINDPNPDTPENKEFTEEMKDKDVALSFVKMGINFEEYLNANYPEIADNIIKANDQAQKYMQINKMIALEIPYTKNSKEGLIFWFKPTTEFLNALPKRISEKLKKEFQMIKDEVPVCGAPIDAKTAYLDVWRTCSGAIENLMIYPNPAKDNLNFKFNLHNDRIISYEIQDMFGNPVSKLNELKPLNTGVINSSIDISTLKPGFYFFVVKSISGEQTMQRFIKE